MRICLAQVASRLGALEKNLELHRYFVEKARKRRAGLIVFPELSLTGYTLMDMVPEVGLRPEGAAILRPLKALSRGIDIVFGFVEEKERGLFYNSAAYYARGKILHVHRKAYLPTYGMFEEGKFFAPGRNFGVFQTSFGKTGLLICREFLSLGANYLLFAGGAELIIAISAAPGRGMTDKEGFTTSRMWELMGEALSFFTSSYVIYCNRVGFEDGKAFAGGSFIFDPWGKLVAKAPPLAEELIVTDLDFEEVRAARKKWPFKRDEKPEILLQSLKRIVESDED